MFTHTFFRDDGSCHHPKEQFATTLYLREQRKPICLQCKRTVLYLFVDYGYGRATARLTINNHRSRLPQMGVASAILLQTKLEHDGIQNVCRIYNRCRSL